MHKYTEAEITFSEVPEEISLCINISNCPCHCKGCHSPHLAEDIGEKLTLEKLTQLIEGNKGISCVAFMGGDSNPSCIHSLAVYIRNTYPKLKIAWYSGREELPNIIKSNLQSFDYIKTGPYREEFGPLNNPGTNQRFFKVDNGDLIDLTYTFWKK